MEEKGSGWPIDELDVCAHWLINLHITVATTPSSCVVCATDADAILHTRDPCRKYSDAFVGSTKIVCYIFVQLDAT